MSAPKLVAPRFDPFNRTIVVDADGYVESTDWVWHEVTFRLGLWKGSLRSVPDLGLNRDRFKNAIDDDAQAIADDEVNIALRDMIDRGDVAVERVYVPLPYRGYFEAHIRNLRDPNAKPRTVQLNANQ